MPALLAENVLAFLIERALRRQVRWYRRKFSVLICVSCTYKDFFIFRSLILTAVLLAAGAVLKFFAGSVINIGGMKPNFIIAMYCLAIILTRPKLGQALVIGLLAGLICQIPLLNATPLLNIPSEVLGALACGLLIKVPLRIGGKLDLNPLVNTFVSTVVSGGTFALLSVYINVVSTGGDVMVALATYAAIVFGTATFNCILVQVLAMPLKKVLKR